MTNREYPGHPLVGVGGVVISGGRVLLTRRGTEPLLGEWSIPGGLLELGETLTAAVERELREETGLTVRAVALIDAIDRIFLDAAPPADERNLPPSEAVAANNTSGTQEQPSPNVDLLATTAAAPLNRNSVILPSATMTSKPHLGAGIAAPPRYHYVLLDYLCEIISGEATPGSDVTELAFAAETELHQYALAPITVEIIRKAFAISRTGSK